MLSSVPPPLLTYFGWRILLSPGAAIKCAQCLAVWNNRRPLGRPAGSASQGGVNQTLRKVTSASQSDCLTPAAIVAAPPATQRDASSSSSYVELSFPTPHGRQLENEWNRLVGLLVCFQSGQSGYLGPMTRSGEASHQEGSRLRKKKKGEEIPDTVSGTLGSRFGKLK